ncbi:hypothetical protein VTH82DRAFT_5070 [Thermothelomyces myriococcoides]
MKANPARWTLLVSPSLLWAIKAGCEGTLAKHIIIHRCGMALRTSNATCNGGRNRKWKRVVKRVLEILQPEQRRILPWAPQQRVARTRTVSA